MIHQFANTSPFQCVVAQADKHVWLRIICNTIMRSVLQQLPLVLLIACLVPAFATSSASRNQAPRVAIVGGGIGGAAAAYFLRRDNPTWHIELFERDCIGGRAREVTLDGKVLELGASIIHGANKYLLSLAEELNLTLTEGDDTGAAFHIWNGKDFVVSQTGDGVADLWTLVKRYGVSPLRYKWLSTAAGQKFGGIYRLQQQGTAFPTPEKWLQRLGIYEATQQSAADYMAEHLTQGPLRYGAGLFIEELAGSINRINYNQNNSQLNALAGLVSYLPAADPTVYSIAEGNAALPNKLIEAAKLQGLHLGGSVTSITLDDSSGQYTVAVQPPAASMSSTAGTPADAAKGLELQPSGEGSQRDIRPDQHSLEQQEYGPFDAVIIATPLEDSGIALQGLNPEPQLPARSYQRTTTSFVTGYIDASFFDRADVPQGDIFVTNSACTPFSVVASKGTVSVHAAPQMMKFAQCGPEIQGEVGVQQGGTQLEQRGANASQQQGAEQQQQTQQQQGTGQHMDSEQIPLWKVFSTKPLSWHTLRTLFVNGTVVASKSWAAYPRFQPPEKFAPFVPGPGLCYNNALENAASAMEVSAVAARNCALLVQKHVQQMRARRSVEQQSVSEE